MFAKTRSFALAAAVASGLAVASPLPALADGSPVVSLGIALVGPMRLPFYNTTAAPVTTAVSQPGHDQRREQMAV